MKITRLAARELSADLVARWNAIQSARSEFDSPFFRAEYTQAVARVRDDVEVAVLEEDGQPVGFWPYQRRQGDVARPIGSGLTDFQGVILRAGVRLDPWQLLRSCGLAAWHFDHLLAAQTEFIPYHWTAADSPCVELAGGLDAYLAGRRAADATSVLQAQSKQAKAVRQLGPVRLEWHTADRSVLAQLIEWKSAQYAATQVTSPFSFAWTSALLDELLALPPGGTFAPVLSALYFGDTLAAAHFGLRCGSVVHWWFPTYDPELGKFSPGAQLLLELIRSFSAQGGGRIDLGKGPESYKRHFMTDTRLLAEGSVDTRLVTRTMRRTWHQAHHWVRESRLRGPMLVPWRLIRHVRDELIFR